MNKEFEARKVRDAIEVLDRIDAVLTLAKANFPHTTNVGIETVGCTPKASMSVPWFLMKEIADQARLALCTSQDKGEPANG